MIKQQIDEGTYHALRSQIQYEDSLFNQRITWAIMFQALIFIPYMEILTSENQPQEWRLKGKTKETQKVERQEWKLQPKHNEPESPPLAPYQWLISLMGVISCCLTQVSCAAAHRRIRVLTTLDEGWQLPEHFPDLNSSVGIQFFGGLASQGYLILMYLVWSFLFWTVDAQGNPFLGLIWFLVTGCYLLAIGSIVESTHE